MLMSTGMIASVPYANGEQSFTDQDAFDGPVGPEHSGEFLHPFAFSFVQTFVQAVKDSVVTDFSLAIALGIMRFRELMGDFLLGVEACYLLAGKVRSVIRNDGVGEPEATYYVLQEELDNLLSGDFRERHCLNPFGEVVGGY